MASQTTDRIDHSGAHPGVGVPRMRRRVRRRGQPPLALTLAVLVVAVFMLVPLAYLVLRASESDSGVIDFILRGRTLTVMRNSVVLAAAVAAAGTAIAIPLAWLTTRTDIPGRRFWAVVCGLPLVIPSYVGALVMVSAFGPRGLLQGWLEGPFGVERLPSLYGFTGAWVVLTLFTYPYIYMSVRAALVGLDPSLEDASMSLGYGRWQTFFRCVLPQLRPAVAAGGLLAALYTISDFGVVTLLRYDVFTRAIYVQYRSSFDRSGAALLGMLLVFFAIGLVLAEAWVRGRSRYHSLGSGSRRRARTLPLGRWTLPALLFTGSVAALALGIPLFVLIYWIVRGLSGGEGLDRLPALV
ncbi:MAG: ABC transporter permease subunit, partial [Chloroflexota bacterium]|nr:ABC transporter permease subunit [Chloroflexota bacterium]